VISVGVGHSVAEAKSWKDEFGLTYPVLADPSGVAWSKFGMGYIPHNAVMNDDMICQFTNYGFNEGQIRNLLTTNSAPLVKIIHELLPNTENTADDYQVDADIFSDGNIVTSSTKIFWNTNGSATFNEAMMTNTSGNSYRGYIPAQPTGTTVYYYVHAEADNGKASNYPLLAPEVTGIFDVLVDTDPPVIDHTAVEAWLSNYWPATLNAEITDVIGVATAVIEFNVNGGSTQTVAMSNTADDSWTGTLTGTVQEGDVVNYRIRATDSSAASNESVLPTTGWYAMNISALIDALVLDLDGNSNSGPVIRDTLRGIGIETHYLTVMPPLPDLYKTIWLCLGVAPNNYSLSAAQDTQLYNYLVSGRNLYIEGGNFWKDDARVDLYFEFGLGTTGSGEGDAGSLVGEAGSIAAGMSFTYTGDNSSIDRLKTKAGGVGVLKNASPSYLATISRDAGTYKTIGSSIEFGGLTGGSLEDLMTAYAEFLTLTPGSAPTPTPTPDPTLCDTLGVTISMPSNDFTVNDMVNTIVTACNPDTTTVGNIPLFVILDVYGDMYFYPSFTDFGYTVIDLPPGETDFVILPDFPWPPDAGSASGINWYAGMTNPEMTDLLGAYDSFTFGWH